MHSQCIACFAPSWDTSRPAGRTRLLYRMSLDFMHWTRHVPGIDAFWRGIAEQARGPALCAAACAAAAGTCVLCCRLVLTTCCVRHLVQVLGEDLVLVRGQQDRMSRGADVWRNPVSYDKLGVRYRRWRNSGKLLGLRCKRAAWVEEGRGAAGGGGLPTWQQCRPGCPRSRAPQPTRQPAALPPLLAAVASGDPSAREQAEASLRQMSAGEVFSSADAL